jgi:hypothetical protein
MFAYPPDDVPRSTPAFHGQGPNPGERSARKEREVRETAHRRVDGSVENG